MGFRFAARTIIELGKELISSDEVALYELLKNSIDAQSERVEIVLNVCLKSSDYREAIARIREEKQSRTDVIDFLRSVLIDECSQRLPCVDRQPRPCLFRRGLPAFPGSTL